MKFSWALNQYDCSRVGLLGQDFLRTSQNKTLTYQSFQIQMSLVEMWIDGGGILVQGQPKLGWWQKQT